MNSEQKIRTLDGSNANEGANRDRLTAQLRNSPIPNNEILDHLGVYMTRQTLSRINFMQKMYEMIIPISGVIMEFGVRWGQNLSIWSALRGIHEPYNYSRTIVGFDTFDGFPTVHPKDGNLVAMGDYAVADNWKDELEKIMEFHEKNAPIPHKKKFELVQGDATKTFPKYLERHPETVVALAYFDFDLYEPTKECLKHLMPYITKGSVIVFDELNCPDFPGETVAVREALGLSKYSLRREPNTPLASYIVVD